MSRSLFLDFPSLFYIQEDSTERSRGQANKATFPWLQHRRVVQCSRAKNKSRIKFSS